MFKVGDAIVRIPKPFLLGFMFATIPERIARSIKDSDPGAWEGFVDSLINQVPNPIPTGTQPPLEMWANKSFFTGRPLTPEGEKKLPKELQYGTFTTEVAKTLSKMFGGVVSPREIDNAIGGYFGGLGNYASQTADAITNGLGFTKGIRTADRGLLNIPAIKGFIAREPIGSGSTSVDRFYAGLTRAESAEQAIKRLNEDGKKSEAEQYAKDHPEWELAKHYRKLSKKFSDIRKQSLEIQKDNKLTPIEKRDRIRELDKLMTYIAQDALKFDGKWNIDGDKLKPYPDRDSFNNKINESIKHGRGDYYSLANEYNDQLKTWLENIRLSEEEKDKIWENNKFNLTYRSIRQRRSRN